uniref:Uncharacterized protein n=1 Tax=Fundulus heteroclitus TaxID=8078 RepID=A0A3Q2NS98_FUNHE
FTLRADRKKLNEASRYPKICSWDQQRLHTFAIQGRCAQKLPLLFRKNMNARINFARKNVDNDKVTLSFQLFT